MELLVTGPNLAQIKKALTIRDEGVIWQVRHLKKKITHWAEVRDSIRNSQFADSSDAAKKLQIALDKIEKLSGDLAELEPNQIIYLYTEEDEHLVIPPGMWFLCASIVGNEHVNTQLAPYILPACETRPYQVEALNELYKHKRGVIELATGLGKSKLIESIALAGVKAGKRVMIVVPTELLVIQMLDEMKGLHENTTAQGGGRQAKPGWDILVTTIQSAQGFSDIPHVVLLDEAHHSPAATWMRLLAGASEAEYVYSFTATAFRSDGLDMAIHAFVGPIVYSRDVRWGIENNWLSPFHVFTVVINPIWTYGANKGKKIHLPDHVPAASAYKILANCYESMVFLREKLAAGLAKGRRPIIVYKTVESCKRLREFCKDSIEMNVASAQAGKKSKAPIYRFKKGEERILLANSSLISEGLDIPSADMLFLCTQNSSDIVTLQALGRVLRLLEGKTNAVVINFEIRGYGQFERAGEKRRALFDKINPDNHRVVNL
jgi:superfamily II DNA or RNA helicase